MVKGKSAKTASSDSAPAKKKEHANFSKGSKKKDMQKKKKEERHPADSLVQAAKTGA